MSSLINNLNSILNTKEEIKEILGTNSEIFADYPAYISEAIASGGASGYAYITTNGDHNIATYAMVNVNVPQQEVPVIPDGYTYVFGTKSITDNADGIDISSYAYVDVNVPVPPEYIVPAGYAYITTNGDFDIRDFEAVNVAVPQSGVSGYSYIITNGDFNIAAYEMVNVNVPIPSGYVFPTGTYNIGLNGIYTLPEYAYAYVSVPATVIEVIPDGYTYVFGTKLIDNNGTSIDVSSYAYVDVEVSGGSVSGTYYATENGTYDISQYEYVDVNVQGSSAPSYTWSNLALTGNLKIYHATDVYWNNGVSLGISYTTGSGLMSHTDYYKIIGNKQFGYILPTEVAATQWVDWDTNSYYFDGATFSGCAYTCDPADWDNMTNVLDAETGSVNYCYSYVVTPPDVYYMNANSGNTVYPWGGNVHSMHYLTDMAIMRWHEAESEHEEPWSEVVGHLSIFRNGIQGNYAYMTQWSYFGGEETDIRNLAGQDWKVVIEKYQDRYVLKDIVGPVAGSEHYMEECNDVWANWDGGWNGSTYTMTYNSNTSCIEMEYVKTCYTGSVQNTFNLYQLEYRIDTDGAARRIRCNADNVPTASLNNLSGTTYLSVVPKTSSGNPECDVLYMDSDFNQSTTYTNYTVDLKLCIPHDMWIYGSQNHDKMWVEWTVTPDDTPLPSATVTGIASNIGTSWNSWNPSAQDTWGSSDGNGHHIVTVTKSNKTLAQVNSYKSWRVGVEDSISQQTTWHELSTLTPVAVDSTNMSGSTTVTLTPSDQHTGYSMLNLDTTEIENTLGITSVTSVSWTLTVDDDTFFDSSSPNYMKATLSWSMTY